MLSIAPATITSTAAEINLATRTALEQADSEQATAPSAGASSHTLLAAVLAGGALLILLLLVGAGGMIRHQLLRKRAQNQSFTVIVRGEGNLAGAPAPAPGPESVRLYV